MALSWRVLGFLVEQWKVCMKLLFSLTKKDTVHKLSKITPLRKLDLDAKFLIKEILSDILDDIQCSKMYNSLYLSLSLSLFLSLSLPSSTPHPSSQSPNFSDTVLPTNDVINN
jgi:hypothetical protein